MLGNTARERRLLESTYDGKMDVIGFQSKKVDGETCKTTAVLYRDVPCALSQGADPKTQQGDDAGEIAFAAKLFCAPEWVIPPGCEIIVTQYGRQARYGYSGEAGVYPTHQELTVQRKDRA